MPVVRLNSGAEFESNSVTPILDAAAKSEIALPYSCRTGRCSTCKCKVLSGTTHALHPEIGLSEQDKVEGWVLSCVRIADTDLFIEVDELERVTLPTVRTLPCKISRIERLAPDVIQVNLKLPPAADFIFIPGQYIDIIGPNGIRRSYSLASSYSPGKDLELHIRGVPCGVMSNYWFNQARTNDLLRLNGPLGTFFLRDMPGMDAIFLATGTGIAPFKSILESLAEGKYALPPKSVTVLWGGRRVDDLYFDFSGSPGLSHYLPVLSRPDDDWHNGKGYVQDVLLDRRPDLRNVAVYACGSGAMIHGAKTLLAEAGLPAKRFYSEVFTSSEKY